MIFSPTTNLLLEEINNVSELEFQESTIPVAESEVTTSPLKYSLVVNCGSNIGKLFLAIILPEELISSKTPTISFDSKSPDIL